MAKKKSLTSQLYRSARLSNNARAASRGPTALGKRVVRRKVNGVTARSTGGFLRLLGLQGGGKRR